MPLTGKIINARAETVGSFVADTDSITVQMIDPELQRTLEEGMQRTWLADARRRLPRAFQARPPGMSEAEFRNLTDLADEAEKARVLRVRISQVQDRFGDDFGTHYGNGLADIWREIDDIGSLRVQRAGLNKAYGLHSPHEFGATSFEQYLITPDVLEANNLEVFNFFENYYKEGVFKRYIDYLRGLEDAIKRKDH